MQFLRYTPVQIICSAMFNYHSPILSVRRNVDKYSSRFLKEAQ